MNIDNKNHLTLNDLYGIHNEAMELSFHATEALLNNNFRVAKMLMIKAYEKEKYAALYLLDKLDIEPTRSILFRSADSMAIEIGLKDEAKILIEHALKGNVPDSEKEILSNLLESC